MIKPITAYAVVSKSRPRLNILQIYSKKDIKDIWIDDVNENLIEVVITPKKK